MLAGCLTPTDTTSRLKARSSLSVPEILDLARALLARGHTGKVTMLDGATGKPRTIIDIEKAAKVRTVETPRFRRVERYAESPPAAETQVVGYGCPHGQGSGVGDSQRRGILSNG